MTARNTPRKRVMSAKKTEVIRFIGGIRKVAEPRHKRGLWQWQVHEAGGPVRAFGDARTRAGAKACVQGIIEALSGRAAGLANRQKWKQGGYSQDQAPGG